MSKRIDPAVLSKSSYQTEGFYFTKERTADGKITPEELAAMLDECRQQIDYIKTLSSPEKELLLARENTTLYTLLKMQEAQSVHVDPNILLEDHNTIPYEVERRLNNKRTLAANDDPEGNLQHGQPVTSADECITYGLNNRTFYSYYEPGEATANSPASAHHEEDRSKINTSGIFKYYNPTDRNWVCATKVENLNQVIKRNLDEVQ